MQFKDSFYYLHFLQIPGTLIGYGFNPLEYGQIVLASKVQFLITGTIFLTAGSMILVWLGEQITEKGMVMVYLY